MTYAVRRAACTTAHEYLLGKRRALAPGLDAADAAVVDLAEKVAEDATSVTAADIERLRSAGLSDGDVVLAAAARCFFGKVLDALGVQPDADYARLEPRLRHALAVGRPIDADRPS